MCILHQLRKPLAFLHGLGVLGLVACGGDGPGGPGTPGADSTALAAAADAMLQALPAQIAAARAENEALIPANPQHAALLQAKIAMLDEPDLADAIARDARWAGVVAPSMGGRTVVIVAVFPRDSMRTGAQGAVATLEDALPVLEAFFDRATFDATDAVLRVWYGFQLGNNSGGGVINSEDRGTYEARTPTSRLPFDAILGHELAHVWIPHESLTQFLELYAYNVARTGARDVAAWTFTRGYAPFDPGNTGVHALLDVYQLIGWDAMATAYRAVRVLAPAYGVPLGDAAKQPFVDAAPAAQQSQVAALMDRITF